MIDLTALRTLDVMSRCGSVVAAAAELGVTPSAVSQQIKRLEKQTRVHMLERVGRGVVLTARARALVEQASRVLELVEELEAGFGNDPSVIVGDLSIVGLPAALRGLAGPAVGALMHEHPGLRIRLQESDPEQALAAVAAGQADVALVHQWDDQPLALPTNLDSRIVHRDEVDAIVHEDHPLAGRRALSAGDLVDEPWICTRPGTIGHDWLLRCYDSTERTAHIEHTSRGFDSHPALVAAGLGVAMAPRLGRHPLPPKTRAVPFVDPAPQRDVVAAWRRSQAESPALRVVLDALG